MSFRSARFGGVMDKSWIKTTGGKYVKSPGTPGKTPFVFCLDCTHKRNTTIKIPATNVMYHTGPNVMHLDGRSTAGPGSRFQGTIGVYPIRKGTYKQYRVTATAR